MVVHAATDVARRRPRTADPASMPLICTSPATIAWSTVAVLGM